MEMSQSPSHNSGKERKTRACGPKVRTGCLACKRRHKKCDEGQPRCLACIRAGYTCEYKETLDRRTCAARGKSGEIKTARRLLIGYDHHPSPLSLAPVVSAGQARLRPNERRYLDFFREMTAVQCAGYFYDGFWQRLVHQVSEQQPAICHAVIALGSLHYRFLQLQVGDSSESGILDKTFPLQQTNKAIACLRQTLQANHLSRQITEVALVACIVLASTMLFQEDAQWAGQHLQSGLKLLHQYQRDNLNQSMESLAITQAFAGVHMGWLTFSTPEAIGDDGAPPIALHVPSAIQGTTVNICEASNFVMTLARLVMLGEPQVFTSKAETLLSELCGWRRQIKESASVSQGRLPQRDCDALALLELWIEVLYIILSVETQSLFQPRETRYDAFLVNFQHSVALAKKLLTSSSTPESTATFSVNMGIIAPLFFCGFKCRDWLVRQEALLLLRRWRRQEGIWSSSETARLLTRMIEIESEGLAPDDIIPAASRIETVNVDVSEAGSGLRLRYRRPGDEHWEAEWMT